MNAIDKLTIGVPGQEPDIPPADTPPTPAPLQDTTLTPLPEKVPEIAAAKPTPARSAVDELTMPKPVEEPKVSAIDSLTLAPQASNADLLYGPWPGAKLKPESERDVFGRGIAAGGYQTHMAIEAVSGLAKKAFGDEQGFRDSMSLAMMWDNKASALAPKYGIIDSVRKGSVGDILSALGFALGEQMPNIATMLVSGGVAGGLTKMAAEAYARKIISKEIRDEIIATATRRAAVAGAFLGVTTQETGSTATEAYQATGDVNIPVAVGAGVAKGALETIVPFGLASKFGFGKAIDAGLMEFISSFVEKKFGGGIFGKVAGGAASAGIEEATTEGMQETVDAAARAYVDKNYKFLSAATRDRILEAAATGGLVGAIFGSAPGGGHGGHSTIEADIATAAAGGAPPPPPSTTPPAGPVAPGSATVPVATAPGGVASSPSAEVGAVRNLTNGAVPTLDDLPKKVDLNTLQTAPGLTIPPAAIPHVVQAIIKRNAAVRLANRNAAPAEVAKATAAAQHALLAAHAAGLSYGTGTSADTTVLAPGAAVGGGPAAASTGTAAGISSAPAATVAAGTQGTPGPSTAVTAGSKTLPATTVGTGAVSTTTAQPTAAPTQVIPPTETAVETAKAIPKDANPHVDAMLQAFRDIINEQGGIGKLLPAMKKAFLGGVPRGDLLARLQTQLQFLALRSIATTRNIDPRNITTHLNLKTGEMEVQIAGKFKTEKLVLPLSPEKLTQYTKEILLEKIARGEPTLSFRYDNQHMHGTYRASPRLENNAAHDPESFLSNGIGETLVTTADGKHIHWKDLKPGQVGVTGKTGVWLDAKSLRFLERLIAKFMPGQKLIVNTERAPDSLGFYARFPNNFNLIQVEPLLPGGASFPHVSIMFHELGHMLVHHVFKNESLAVQTALYNAYLAEIKTGTWDEVNFLTGGPVDVQVMLEKGHGLMSQAGYLDWFNFDEWMAEQVSRFFMTNPRAAGFVDRFFDKAASMMKSMWASLFTGYEARTGQPYVANAAVTEWLESLYKNRKTGQPLLMPASIEAMRESSIENLKWSNKKDVLDPLTNSLEDLVAAAPPEQPQSAAIRQVENRLGFWGNGQVAAQSDKYHFWIRRTWSLLQIAQQNPAVQTLQNYVGLIRQWSITRMHFISQSNTTLKTWRQLGKVMSANLNAFIYDLDSMSYLPSGHRARWPTPAEQAAMAARHGLDTRALAVYDQVKTQFSEVLDRLERAWIGSAMQIRDPIQQAVKLLEINKQMQMLRVKPYFPHARYGDWTMSVKDVKGKLIFFQQFDSKRARDDAIGPARAAYPGHTVTGDKTPGEMQQFSGIPPGILRDLQGRLGLTVQQQQVLDAFIFDMSPANSFAQKFKKRKNIKGFDINAQRAFANYFVHAAGHIARLEYGEQLQQAVNDTRTTARGDLTGKRQGIADWMQRHLDYIMHPPEEWTALRSVAFMHHLAWSPAAAFINLTQVPMVAVPYLSSRFGNLAVMPEFAKAAWDIRQMWDAPNSSRLAPDLIDALDEGKIQGFLDQSQATELASASEGTTLMKILPGTRLQRSIAHLGHWSSYLFQAAEKVNRNVTFATAYRLAQQNPTTPYLMDLEATNTALVQDLLSKGWNPENVRAFLAGRDAVDKTQFEYSKWNRPEFMRGKKGVIFTFYMYKQNMLHFFAHQPGGYKALALVLAFAGLQGLPWEEEVNDLIRGITELFGLGRLDLNAEMRKFLAELTDRPDLIMHGLGRETWGLGLLGDALGIPMPSVDVSGSMGFGQVDPLISPIVHGLETGQNFAEQLGNVTAAAAGATIGVGLAYTKMLEGDLTKLRTWLPALPRYMKNVAQAFDLYNNSGYVNAAGAKMVPFDLTDTKTMAEILAQGMGFTPTRIAQQKELTSAQVDAYKYWTMRRNILLDNLWKAYQAHDAEAQKSVKDRIKYFNETAPDNRLKIGFQSMIDSMRNRQKAVKQMEKDLAPSTVLSGVGKQVKQLYPEVP